MYFRRSKLGLSRASYRSFIFCFIAHILGNFIGIPYLVHKRNPFTPTLHDFNNLLSEPFLGYIILPAALIMISLAFTFGAFGMLRPNPSFRRGLTVAILPLLTPFAIVNLMVFSVALIVFQNPTVKEKESDQGLIHSKTYK